MDDRRYEEALLFSFSISLIVLFPEIYPSYFVFNCNSCFIPQEKKSNAIVFLHSRMP